MQVKNKKGLKFLQINLHHDKDANTNFCNIASDCKVGLITEPYSYDGKIKLINTGQLIYKDNLDKYDYPRACIWLHSSVKNYFMLNDYCDRDFVAIKLSLTINNKIHNTVMCSVYMDKNKNLPTKLQKIISYCDQNNLD